MIDVSKFEKHYYNVLDTNTDPELRRAFSRIVEGLQAMDPTRRQDLIQNADVTLVSSIATTDQVAHFALGMTLAGSIPGTQVAWFRVADTGYYWVTSSPRDLANRLYFNIFGTSITGKSIVD